MNIKQKQLLESYIEKQVRKYLNEENSNERPIDKANWTLIKKWWNTVNDNGYDEFTKFAPKEWDTNEEVIKNYGENSGVDRFKSLIVGNTNGNHMLVNKKYSMFGLPLNINIFEYLNANGSGFNKDKNFNKYKRWQGAIYDIYEGIKNKLK